MPSFKTLHTRAGLIAMASAEAAGTPINLTHMAVGDGNGNEVLPDELQSGLVRERFRAGINRVFQSPDDPQRFTAELVIPATEGGFTLREVGVFDADGTLFAVGNLPATYKPQASEGAYADTVVRLDFMVSNADVITLQIDPNVAVATQTWISNTVTAATLIPGGTTGQFLAKASNADGDVNWVNPDDITVAVNTIEETQDLAAGQTVVTWAVVTTIGLAVYVDGLRLEAGEWDSDPADAAIITLATAYPAGSKITGVQNEPAGTLPNPLEKSLNLADVPNKPLARDNLDVMSRAESRQLSPAGQIGWFARSTAPVGWLKANGAAVSRTAYADLFAAIGTIYGAGDGFNTFNLPDYRGEFLRGWDDGRGMDAGRIFGSVQGGQNAAHTHTGAADWAGEHAHVGSTGGAGGHSHGASSRDAGWHGHGGSIGEGGSHSHSLPSNSSDNTGNGFVGDSTGVGTNRIASTYPAGQHSHALNITESGNHNHAITVNGVGDHSHTVSIAAGGGHAHSFTTNPTGGTEARPRNIAVLVCIKY